MIPPIAPLAGYLGIPDEFTLDRLKSSLTTLQHDLQQVAELREAGTLSQLQASHETQRYLIHIKYLEDLIALTERTALDERNT